MLSTILFFIKLIVLNSYVITIQIIIYILLIIEIFYKFFFFYIFYLVFPILSLILSLLMAIAYFVLLERKVMASMQRRRGPNVVGVFGILQPLADALKLLLKETIVPGHSNVSLFLIAPVFTFFCSLLVWIVVPFFPGAFLLDFHMNILYVFSISSLGVYGIIFSGWSSNSKYAFLGGLRSAAQMIAYEINIGIVFAGVILFSRTVNLTEVVTTQKYVWFIFPLFPLWVIFIISALAETNRAPFDLPEAEAELVAGYNVEYSAMSFALFFLGEYGNMLLVSTLSCIFFFGGWLSPVDLAFLNYPLFWFSLKLSIHIFFFIWVRAAFPRLRYDQLMNLGWKVFLPFSLSFVYFEMCIFVFLRP